MTPLSEIDALFTLPLGEFTAARNALASRLKKAGQSDEAARIKALPRPPATAWAVNQLFWQQRKEIDRLLSIGDKVREAQTGKGGDLRPLLVQRRKVVSELSDRAVAFLEEAGHAASQDAKRRIGITLDSLAAWGRSNVETQAGRLTADLEPIGFDGLAALLDGRKLEPAKVLQFRRAGQEKKSRENAAAALEKAAVARKEAAEAVKVAERKLSTARREAQRAESSLARAQSHGQALEDERREIAARCSQAQEEVRSASSEAKKASQSVAEAERALALAREALA